ncbi:MAG: gliding motility-associated C-terminal domain-containing protein, partial [Flavobacteriales bacterium]|nr:gliding motility-associated C-terminal domain-containing protein [Flavobacteriales bacterium]
RPVAIKTNTSILGEFAVRCAGIDPDIDIGLSFSGATGPFFIAQKEENIETINNQFYHNIFQLSGSSVYEAKIAYFNSDGSFSSVAQWTSTLEWSNLKTPTQTGTFSTFYNQPDYFASFFIETPDHDEFVLIQPNEIFNIYVPNAFTPDGDGLNDVFVPVLYGYENFKEYGFLIFNRWGEIIFETNKEGIGWPGTYKNEKVQLGVYTWKLNFSAIENNNLITHKKIGRVTIVQ